MSDSMDGIIIQPASTGLSETSKKQLFELGIFTVLLLIIMAILSLFIMFSRNSWKNGLKNALESVLKENGYSYSIEEMENLDNPFSVSCALYKCKNLSEEQSSSKAEHIVLVRMQTLYGAMPAVFFYDDEAKTATFVDFVSLHGKAKKSIEDGSHGRILYWEKRIPGIVNGHL